DFGQHDPDYVDAFYGPAEWKTQAENAKKSLDQIAAEAAKLSAILNQDRPSSQSSPSGRGGWEKPASKTSDAATSGDEMLKLRREYLQKQNSAPAAPVRMLKGEKLKFDDESRAFYDAVALIFPDSHFDQIIAELEKRILGKNRQSGSDPLWERYEKWRKPFMIPKEKLDKV